MSRPKSILKYRPESNIELSTVIPPTSWFSRLQSKLYSNTTPNEEETEEYQKSLSLPKHDLRKVTFSVGNLTVEHPFCSQDSPRDEEYEKEKQAADILKKLQQANEVIDLPNHYEHACIQREEYVIDRFRDILRTSRTSQLKSIDLSKETIAPNQAGPISDIFILRFGLTRLNFANCKMDDETIRILLCSLLVSNTIEHLNLSQNNFKSKGYKYIAIFMKESKTIKSVDLSHCTIEKMGMKYLSQGIKYATSLEKLILDYCQIKPPATEPLEVFSTGVHQSTLKTLSICHIQSVPSPSSTWISNLIANDEDKNAGLIDLNLTGNNLSLITPLADLLSTNRTLVNLNLSDCNITHEGLSVLSNALAENKCLESLDLSNNPLTGETDEGILTLKTALARNPCLQSLNLSNTQLDSSAAIALAEALPENTFLSRLDLSKNPHIEMAGILALAVSIKMNHTLTFLDINIPPADEELANLQNDIVAVCTTNMLQKVEAQKLLEEKTEITTLSPSSSSSSNSSTLDTAVIELPSNDVFINSKNLLDGLESPQLAIHDSDSSSNA
ncbi:hypothetical protein BDF21DRAFT_412217 [Thamnidium elegans]|nr:hypothetical protein BDF21DRAFT_412217 [Thamnidium elegans]